MQFSYLCLYFFKSLFETKGLGMKQGYVMRNQGLLSYFETNVSTIFLEPMPNLNHLIMCQTYRLLFNVYFKFVLLSRKKKKRQKGVLRVDLIPQWFRFGSKQNDIYIRILKYRIIWNDVRVKCFFLHEFYLSFLV